MCGCNSPKKPIGSNPASMLSSSGNFSRESVSAVLDDTDKTQMVTIEYVGPNVAPFTMRSHISRDISYRFANSENHRYKSVFLGDAEWLIGLANEKGQPIYRIVSNVETNQNDPAVFAGKPILA